METPLDAMDEAVYISTFHFKEANEVFVLLQILLDRPDCNNKLFFVGNISTFICHDTGRYTVQSAVSPSNVSGHIDCKYVL